MFKKLDFETKVGGLFGIIAIIATIVEMNLAGFTPEAITGGIKDIAGTIVIVLIFVFAARHLFDKRPKETFENVLSEELSQWEKRNSPLVLKATDYPRIDESTHEVLDKDKWCRCRFYLLTNLEKIIESAPNEDLLEKYSVNAGRGNGRFVEIPVDFFKKDIIFYLNISTFKGRADAKKVKPEDEIENLSGHMKASILEKFKDLCTVHSDKNTISVRLLPGVELNADTAREIIKLLDYVFLLYAITC